MSNTITQYVIYNNPSDCPNKFVVRKWLIVGSKIIPSNVVGAEDTLEEARKLVPDEFSLLPLFDNDDPCIEEVYI